MTGFDLLTNYVEDLEALIRRTRAKLKKVLALKLQDNHIRQSLTPEFEAMANRTLLNSLLQLRPTSVLDQQSMLEIMDLSSSQLSSTWCKQTSFVERHMKMQVHISSWRSTAPSPSEE